MLAANLRATKTLLARTLANQHAYRHFATLLKFSEDHEWIQYDTDSKTAKLGITDYA